MPPPEIRPRAVPAPVASSQPTAEAPKQQQQQPKQQQQQQQRQQLLQQIQPQP